LLVARLHPRTRLPAIHGAEGDGDGGADDDDEEEEYGGEDDSGGGYTEE
jgi:hypothetical protein